MKKSIVKKAVASALCLTLALSSMVGCSKPATGGDPQGNQSAKEKIVRLATWSGPTGAFNPILMNNDFDADVINLVYEPLLMVNPELVLEPALAESFEYSEDALSVTFKLRQGVKWHDGEAFTAEDVQFTYEFLAHKDYTGFYSSYPKPLVGYKEYFEGTAEHVSGIEVIDEYTIKFTAATPIGASMEDLFYWTRVIPKHIWKDIAVKDAKDQTELLRNPIGTGCFIFKEFQPDQYTIVEKNKEYWGGEPKLDKIIFQVTNPETVQAQALKGEIDFMQTSSLNPDDLKAYEDAGFQLQMTPLLAYTHMLVDNTNPLLSDKRVRQAILQGINRQGIVDTTIFGHGKIANTVYPEFFWAHPGNDKLNAYEYSPEKAIEILTKEVGWEYKDGKMFANGTAVKLSLLYPSGNKARELAAPIIQENLKGIGIEVELNVMEPSILSTKVKDEQYDLAIMANGFGTSGDVTKFFHTDSIKNSNNFVKYSNPELDKLLLELKNYNTPEEKKPISDQIAIIVNEDLPTLFLYNYDEGTILSPKLKGVKCSAFTNYYKVHLWELVD